MGQWVVKSSMHSEFIEPIQPHSNNTNEFNMYLHSFCNNQSASGDLIHQAREADTQLVQLGNLAPWKGQGHTLSWGLRPAMLGANNY